MQNCNCKGIPEKWERDPGVGPRTQDPKAGPWGGTLGWSLGVDPWGGTLGCDPGVGP